ncbi:MAG TPA: HAD hydrolase-like protein, partial [Burkholderiales bacterium]|nr:HAD hydrolase-like protein [Burkholderiales bacterium]
MIKAVLFDLDGTFADTAPDLGYAVNQMRVARGLAPVPDDKTRPVTSSGARGLLRVGFDITPDHPDYPAMRDEFLDIYQANLCRETRLFDGMAQLVDALEARSFTWGIVTNKAERFALPLMNLLGYGTRVACVIGGDTTGKLKPHPEPLYAAARAIKIAP